MSKSVGNPIIFSEETEDNRDFLTRNFADQLYMNVGEAYNSTLDMNKHKIINVQNPESQSDAINKKYIDEQLILKADNTTIEEIKSNKASTDYVDQQLKTKVDNTLFNEEISLKVDKTYFDQELARKSTIDYVDNEIASNVDQLQIELGSKADTTFVNEQLILKADLNIVESLNEKIKTINDILKSHSNFIDGLKLFKVKLDRNCNYSISIDTFPQNYQIHVLSGMFKTEMDSGYRQINPLVFDIVNRHTETESTLRLDISRINSSKISWTGDIEIIYYAYCNTPNPSSVMLENQKVKFLKNISRDTDERINRYRREIPENSETPEKPLIHLSDSVNKYLRS